jgi:ABC-type glycerol-3-phosphate transport system permease component
MVNFLKKLDLKQTIILIVMVIAAMGVIGPLIWMLFTSLKPTPEIYQYPPTYFPRKLTLEHYLYVIFNLAGFRRYFLNSVVVTIFSVIIVLITSAMGGYAFGCRRFRGQNGLFMGILLVLALPYIMYLIPIYIMEWKLHLRNTWLGLILPYAAINLPWGLLIMRGAFSTIPMDIRDAAIIDGCNEFQLWYRVLLPITKPALAATTIITFVFVWQEYMFGSTLMTKNQWQTLPVGVVWMKDELQTLIYGRIGAMIILTLIPVLIIFLAMKNFFIKGLSEGMLKG